MRPWSAHVGQEVRLSEYGKEPVGWAHFRGQDASGKHLDIEQVTSTPQALPPRKLKQVGTL